VNNTSAMILAHILLKIREAQFILWTDRLMNKQHAKTMSPPYSLAVFHFSGT